MAIDPAAPPLNPAFHNLIKLLARIAVEDYLAEIKQMPPREKSKQVSKISKQRKYAT